MALKVKVFNHTCECDIMENKINEFLTEKGVEQVTNIACSDIRGGMHVIIIYRD